MTETMKRICVGAAIALTLTGGAAVLATIQPSATAAADVCASVGRRVSVGGCANLGDVMAPWVMPPNAYAPLTPAASACVGWNGRWVDANTCT